MNFYIPLESNTAPNPCVETSCPGACCMNVVLSLKVWEAHIIIGDSAYKYYDRKADFELGISTLHEILFYCGKNRTIPRILSPRRDALQEYRQNGSFESANALVWIPGHCPNLGRDGFCNVYENRPSACRNLQFGGEKCRSIRRIWDIPDLNE